MGLWYAGRDLHDATIAQYDGPGQSSVRGLALHMLDSSRSAMGGVCTGYVE